MRFRVRQLYGNTSGDLGLFKKDVLPAEIPTYQHWSLHDWNAREEDVFYKLPTDSNPADVMTKPLDYIKHWEHLRRMGVHLIDDADTAGFWEIEDVD